MSLEVNFGQNRPLPRDGPRNANISKYSNIPGKAIFVVDERLLHTMLWPEGNTYRDVCGPKETLIVMYVMHILHIRRTTLVVGLPLCVIGMLAKTQQKNVNIDGEQ